MWLAGGSGVIAACDHQTLIGWLTGPYEDKAWYMCDLPMESVECGQGVTPWAPKSGYTNCKCVTNANP